MSDTLPSNDAVPTRVLMLPGIGDSGPAHWQSRWQADHPGFLRIVQRDWAHPLCQEWAEALDQTLHALPTPVVLVAHSLGCLLVAHWAQSATQTVKAALLVAVPDPLGTNFPPQAQGFAPLPWTPLPFPSVIVASSDDPYATIAHAQACASTWGSRLVNIGAAGHINANSGMGGWPAGLWLLQDLLR